MKKVVGFLLILFLALPWAQVQMDPRYGFIGEGSQETSIKAQTYTVGSIGNHIPGTTIIQNLTEEVDAWLPNSIHVRRIAMLEARNDGLGQTPAQFQAKVDNYGQHLAEYYKFFGLLSKPTFTWFKPNVPALLKADSVQIISTIIRDLDRNASPRIWEIGNEPNVFPNLDPADYAAMYKAYYNFIKKYDPDAIILMGGVFMTELIPPDGQDKIIQILNSRMYKDIYNDDVIAGLTVAGFISGLAGGPLGAILTLGYTSLVLEYAKDDVRKLLTDRMWKYKSGLLYMRAVLNEFKKDGYLYYKFLADATQPVPWGAPSYSNRVSVHVYPADLGRTYDQYEVYSLVTNALKKYRDSLYFIGTPSTPNSTGKTFLRSPIWVTEVGNINYKLTSQQVASRFQYLLNNWGDYTSQPLDPGNGWNKPPSVWLWYKPLGVDAKFAEVLPGRVPPYTRLVEDPNHIITNFWNPYPCSALGPVGQMYFKLARYYSPCAD